MGSQNKNIQNNNALEHLEKGIFKYEMITFQLFDFQLKLINSIGKMC